MSLPTKALTNLANAKQYLGITGTGSDALLENLIRRASAWFEARTGRRFLKQTYTDELYDGGENLLFLNQYPVAVITTIEFRIGLFSANTFQAFNLNDFVLYGEAGYIRFITGGRRSISGIFADGATSKDVQNIRVQYDAGFLIDFTAPDDEAKHTLPLDIEDFILRLVGRRFNARKAEGVSSETVEGAQITWANPTPDQMSADDKAVVRKYEKKLPIPQVAI